MTNNTCFRNLPQSQTKLEELLPIPSRGQISAAGGFSMAAELSFSQPHDEQTTTHQLLQFSAGIDRHLTPTSGFGSESVHGDFSQTLGEHLDIYSLDFPIFNGSNPRMWIKQCTNFFELFPEISDVQRIDLAIWNFEGKAFSWILELPIDDVLAISWTQFCEVVCSMFDMLKVSHDEDALVVNITFEENSSPPYQGFEQYVNVNSKGVVRELSDGVTVFKESECIFEVKATTVDTHLEGGERNDDVGGIVVVKGLEELENVLTSWDPGDSIVGVSSSLSEIIDALKVYEYSMHVHTGITGLLANGRVKRACEFFREMPRRDATSLSVMVSGLIQNDYLDEARMLFLESEEEGEGRNDTMISGYVYASDMESAMKLFFEMKSLMLSKGQGRSMWSYYILLNALAEDGRLEEAAELWQTLFTRNTDEELRSRPSEMLAAKSLQPAMKELYASSHAALLKEDYLLFVYKTYELLDLVNSWEAPAAFFSLGGSEIFADKNRRDNGSLSELSSEDNPESPGFDDGFTIEIFTPRSSLTRVRAIPHYSFKIATLEGLNEIRPTLGIMSSRLPWIDTSPFGSSASQVNTKECSIISGSCLKMLEYIYLVPYSAPSCYYEIHEFIEILQLTLKGTVSSKSCYIDPQYYFDHLCGSEHAQWRVQQKFEDRGLPIELLSSLKQEGSEFLTNSKSTLALDELEILFKALLKSTCINKVVFYLSLARGLDYHTGDAVRKIWLKSCRESFVKMLSAKQLRETVDNKATAHVTHSQLDDLIDFYHLKSSKGMSQLELEDEVQDDLKCVTGECIYCNFTSLDPRGRGSSLEGGSVMAYVDMDYDGDGVKKESSMLVGTIVDLVKDLDDGVKHICRKISSSDPRGRGSYQPRGIVMSGDLEEVEGWKERGYLESI